LVQSHRDGQECVAGRLPTLAVTCQEITDKRDKCGNLRFSSGSKTATCGKIAPMTIVPIRARIWLATLLRDLGLTQFAKRLVPELLPLIDKADDCL
jgi:hypothetical protein